jgi:uncharacterized protein (TIGR02147 family)
MKTLTSANTGAAILVRGENMDVFQFLDPYALMKAFYQERKNADDGFSYSVWAEELAVQSSSTLRMMILGEKKISQGLAEKFVKYLNSEDEKNYFLLLISYAHAASPQEKSAVWAALSKILVARIDQTEVKDHFTYLSDLLLPKLQTVLSFDDLSWTEENLSQVLKVDVETLQSALNTLQDIGLAETVTDLSVTGTVQWQTTARLLKVSDKLGDTAIRRYHDASLDEAKAAQSLAVECRRYRSLLLPMTDEEYQELNKEVDTFVKQLLMKYQSNHYRERRLYKVNLNYFPVAEKVAEGI